MPVRLLIRQQAFFNLLFSSLLRFFLTLPDIQIWFSEIFTDSVRLKMDHALAQMEFSADVPDPVSFILQTSLHSSSLFLTAL